jgi:ribosome recycling factor
MTEDERDEGKDKVQVLLKSFEDKIADMGDKKFKEIMEQ